VPKGEFTAEQIAICGDNQECLYDFYITGNSSFAAKTLEGINKVNAMEELAKQKKVFCKDLPSFLYGKWKAKSLKEGSLATVTCQKNAEHEGCTTMRCDANGQWVFHECKWNRTACYATTLDPFTTSGLKTYGESGKYHMMGHITKTADKDGNYSSATLVALLIAMAALW